jgi:hypothetical protein
MPETQSSGQVNTCPVKSPVITGGVVVGGTASSPLGPYDVHPDGLPVDGPLRCNYSDEGG